MAKRLLLFIVALVTMSAFASAVTFAIDCPEGKSIVYVFKGKQDSGLPNAYPIRS